MSLDEMIAHRSAFLTDYQGRGLAERYRKLVKQVRDAAIDGGSARSCRARSRSTTPSCSPTRRVRSARLYTTAGSKSSSATSSKAIQVQSLAPPILGGGARCARAARRSALRPLDDAGVPDAGEIARPARHAARRSATVPTASSSAI